MADVGQGEDMPAEWTAPELSVDGESAAEDRPRAAAQKKRRRRSRGDEPASFLAMYFREMAALDVLEPGEELEAAREIEELEISVWVSLLSWAPAVDHVLKVVEACMENSLVELRTLRRVATEARRAQTKASQQKLVAVARTSAAKLRAMDTDRIYLDAVLGELSRIDRDSPGRIVAGKPPFSPKSQAFARYLRSIATASRAAEHARNDFVKANLRLVVSIARRFNHGRMALADLIQEGNIGLMKAVERYDYRRGFRFSTYASWWIRHAISRALADKGREVRLPVHMIDAYHRIAKAKRELSAKLGRQPNAQELAEVTQIAATKIEKMRTYLVDQSFSLDRPVNEEDGRHFIEFLQDPAFEDESPADRLTIQTLTDEVQGLLRDLKPIEADILRQRFGLDDDRELTLKEIGAKYNLSRERIRQLQEQALSKMRRALARKHML
ncbi:MAG TPA: sigma-70 family RNA polymerase sigma factor [Kofleriaceae bacterium]|nr:sigma-70 family RNA polymerase sigma factor [Kofleriaceae bacterium]